METLAVLSTLGEYAAADTKAREDERRYQQNRINAAASRDLKIASLNQRMIQEGEAAAAQKQQLSIAALQKQERAVVAAGEAGFKGGSSIDNAIDQFETARLRGVTNINAQTEGLRNQIELEKLGASAEAINRINSLPRGQQPNFLSYAVKAAGQVYGIQEQKAFMEPEAVAKRMVDINTEVAKLVPTYVPNLPSVSSISWSGGPPSVFNQRSSLTGLY